jgi:formate dehydrogenase maturation protein FdhE
MNSWWDKQIRRADELEEQSSASLGLMKFYAQLLRSQKEIYQYLRSRQDWLPSGEIENDMVILHEGLRPLLQAVEKHGPVPLSSEAKYLSESKPEVMSELLIEYWHDPSDVQFFGKACLQPYFKWLAESGGRLAGRETRRSERECPFCGGPPQLSFLYNKEIAGEGGNRILLCGRCLSTWEFRRVVCANCGEERPEKLPYFHSSEFDYVRIEACDSCKHYLKGIDLTRLGHAVPLVDEIYAAPLDLWARDQGYKKIELNLVGI